MLDLYRSQPQKLKNELLSGLTVALALVPEAIAFAFVAGVSHGAPLGHAAAMSNIDPRETSISAGLPTLSFQAFRLPPMTLSTLWVIFPFAVVLAAVGLIESLMTLTLIDEITQTQGNSNRECIAQGLANIVYYLASSNSKAARSGRAAFETMELRGPPTRSLRI